MVRENYDNSLIVPCCPLCLYHKLLSISKPEGFDTTTISACTHVCVIMIWLLPVLLSAAATTTHPTDCNSSPRCLQQKVNTIFLSNSETIILKQFQKSPFTTPIAPQTRQSQQMQLPEEQHKMTLGLTPELKTEQKHRTTRF